MIKSGLDEEDFDQEDDKQCEDITREVGMLKDKIKEFQDMHEIYEKNSKEEIEQLKEENDLLKNKLRQLEQTNKELLEVNITLEDQIKASGNNDELLESLIFPINTLDQIASAYRNQGDHDLVAEQLEKVAELTVHQIASSGIEEVPVYGKEIDGEYMESFGQAMNVKDDTLPPHSVAIVSRRAFKKKDTDEIIQHALVYTVPEEE